MRRIKKVRQGKMENNVIQCITLLVTTSANCRSVASYVCSEWVEGKCAHTFQRCTQKDKVGEIYLPGSFMPPHFR